MYMYMIKNKYAAAIKEKVVKILKKSEMFYKQLNRKRNQKEKPKKKTNYYIYIKV